MSTANAVRPAPPAGFCPVPGTVSPDDRTAASFAAATAYLARGSSTTAPPPWLVNLALAVLGPPSR